MDFIPVDTNPSHEVRMREIAKTIVENPKFAMQVNQRIGELAYFSWKDKHAAISPDREAYLTTDRNDRARIVELGNELNGLGGLDTMQFVASVLSSLVKGPSDMYTLDYAWNGIGQWRC